jgi:hypothetical protein
VKNCHFMKKTDLKSVKKTVEDDIKLSLIKELKSLTSKFGDASAKLEKEISKGAKKLAKKISREIKIEEEAVPVGVPETKVAKNAPVNNLPKKNPKAAVTK